MARPQTENGFVMIALDLFVGLMTSGLPDNDSIVLTWVLLQSYGPRKRRDIHLDFAEIEDYTGLHRNNARASARSLVASGYLRRNEDGSYRFLKDWEHFRPKRGTFVGRLKLADFARAALTHEKFIKKSKSGPIQTDFPSTTIAIQPNCPDNSKVNSAELGSSPDGQFTQIGTTAYATPENGDVNPTVATTSEPPLACGRTHTRMRGQKNGREGEIEIVDDDAGANDEPDPIRNEEHRETVDLARELFGEEFAEAVIQQGGDIEHSLGSRWDCYRAAMRKAKQSRGSIHNLHAYCLRTGGTFAVHGPPSEPVAYVPDGPDNRSPPAVVPTKAQLRDQARSADIMNNRDRVNKRLDEMGVG